MFELHLMNYIKQNHFALFELLQAAQAQGLLRVDETNDTVAVTHGLYKAYPGLQNLLNKIVDDWIHQKLVLNGGHAKKPAFNQDLRVPQVRAVFDEIIAPGAVWNMNALSWVEAIEVKDNTLFLKIRFPDEALQEQATFGEALKAKLTAFAFDAIHIQFIENTLENAGLSAVQHILLIASGKGGVGKSTLAFYLAQALQKLNLNIGLLDADLSGPSLPTLIKQQSTPVVKSTGVLEPIVFEKIKMMSPGFLVNAGKAIDWRGVVASGETAQLLHQVDWGYLDCLVIDLPPGTSDVALTLTHDLPNAEVLFVTTAHPLAQADTMRSIDFFKSRKINILGYIENMRDFICPHCQESLPLFHEVHDSFDHFQLPCLAKLSFLTRPEALLDHLMPVAMYVHSKKLKSNPALSNNSRSR